MCRFCRLAFPKSDPVPPNIWSILAQKTTPFPPRLIGSAEGPIVTRVSERVHICSEIRGRGAFTRKLRFRRTCRRQRSRHSLLLLTPAFLSAGKVSRKLSTTFAIHSSLLRRCFTSLPRRTNLGFRHATKVRTMGAVGEPVQLYIYDLSNGLAAMWGRSLTGQDVEGIWCVLSHFLTDPVGRLSYGSAERFRSAGIRPSSCMAWRSFSDKAYRSSRRRARLTLVPFPSLIQRRRCV